MKTKFIISLFFTTLILACSQAIKIGKTEQTEQTDQADETDQAGQTSSGNQTTQLQNPCSSSINNSMPFRIIENATSIKFDYDYGLIAYTPFSYSQQDFPDYQKKGNGVFTLFGDGDYSWRLNPEHSYSESRRYPVWSEVTDIKNGGGPPPEHYHNTDLDVCVIDSSVDPFAIKNLDSGNLHLDISRPMYLNEEHIHIVSFGNMERNKLVDLVITYDPNKLEFVQLISHVNQPFDDYDDYVPGRIGIKKMSIDKNKEYRLFLKFKAVGTSTVPCKFDSTWFQVDILDKENLDSIESMRANYSIQECGPRDPNWLVFQSSPCPSIEQNRFQKHRVKGYYYFIDNNSNAELAAHLKIEAKSSNIYSIELVPGNSGFVDDQMDKKIISINTCNDQQCITYNGQGNCNATRDILGEIEFDVTYYPIQENESFQIGFESEFYYVDTNSAIKAFYSTLDANVGFCEYLPEEYIVPTPKDIFDQTQATSGTIPDSKY